MTASRGARDDFRAARAEEQALYGRAEVYRREHGHYPGDYLDAQAATSSAFERMIGPPAAAAPEGEAAAEAELEALPGDRRRTPFGIPLSRDAIALDTLEGMRAGEAGVREWIRGIS